MVFYVSNKCNSCCILQPPATSSESFLWTPEETNRWWHSCLLCLTAAKAHMHYSPFFLSPAPNWSDPVIRPEFEAFSSLPQQHEQLLLPVAGRERCKVGVRKEGKNNLSKLSYLEGMELSLPISGFLQKWKKPKALTGTSCLMSKSVFNL